MITFEQSSTTTEDLDSDGAEIFIVACLRDTDGLLKIISQSKSIFWVFCRERLGVKEETFSPDGVNSSWAKDKIFWLCNYETELSHKLFFQLLDLDLAAGSQHGAPTWTSFKKSGIQLNFGRCGAPKARQQRLSIFTSNWDKIGKLLECVIPR